MLLQHDHSAGGVSCRAAGAEKSSIAVRWSHGAQASSCVAQYPKDELVLCRSIMALHWHASVKLGQDISGPTSHPSQHRNTTPSGAYLLVVSREGVSSVPHELARHRRVEWLLVHFDPQLPVGLLSCTEGGSHGWSELHAGTTDIEHATCRIIARAPDGWSRLAQQTRSRKLLWLLALQYLAYS